MSAQEDTYRRRFYRRSDNAMLGGVCAGIAEHFGFNLRVTRILAFIAFCVMPMLLLAYIAAMFLIPVRPIAPSQNVDRDFRRAMRASPKQAAGDVRRRFRSLDRRLARLEKYVTSSRYQLDKEFRDL